MYFLVLSLYLSTLFQSIQNFSVVLGWKIYQYKSTVQHKGFVKEQNVHSNYSYIKYLTSHAAHVLYLCQRYEGESASNFGGVTDYSSFNGDTIVAIEDRDTFVKLH